MTCSIATGWLNCCRPSVAFSSNPHLVTLIDEIEARVARVGLGERGPDHWLFGWDDS